MSVDREAHALTAFRVLPNGEGRSYTATTFPRDPYQGCERFVRICRATGAINRDPGGKSYGLLEVLNENGDIIQDFDVPDGEHFRFITKRLNLRVEPPEPPPGEEPAHVSGSELPNPVPVSLSVQEGLMGCGHPLSAVVSADEGTKYCGRCEDEARSVQEGQGEALGASRARRSGDAL